MRTVSTDITNAITQAVGHKQGGRLTVYKSRVYFDALTSNHAPTDAKAIGDPGVKLNEASFILAPASRPSINHQVVIAYVTSSNILYIMLEGNSTPVQLLTGIDVTCRIGFNADNTAETYSLYYYNSASSQWEYRRINIDLLLAGSACLTGVVNSFPELPRGAIYPLEGTDNTFVLFDIYEGAVRVGIHDDHKDTIPNKYRFINPIKVLNSATDDIYLLHKAGAALVRNKVFIYYSHYDGSVRSMICTLQSDLRHGTWSDIRVAVPQDLSIFSLNNVFASNGRIFLSGNFGRTKQFASTATYCLLVWSDDGITFTMNRRVLCSPINLPFQVHVFGSTVIFACTNRIYKTDAPYYLIRENADHTVLSIVNISGSISGEFSVTVASGSEQYFNAPYIDTGSYAKLETSIRTVNGLEYIKYMDCVISQNDQQSRDGGRGHSISLMSDATWHTSVMTQPFYMEFQGKQTVYDPCSDYSNMYKASSEISPTWTLSSEFYDPGSATFSVHTQ